MQLDIIIQNKLLYFFYYLLFCETEAILALQWGNRFFHHLWLLFVRYRSLKFKTLISIVPNRRKHHPSVSKSCWNGSSADAEPALLLTRRPQCERSPRAAGYKHKSPYHFIREDDPLREELVFPLQAPILQTIKNIPSLPLFMKWQKLEEQLMTG